MKIFITGGTGFVGREVVRQLVAAGNRVLILTRNPGTMPQGLPPGVELHKGDIRKPESFEKELDGCQAVIHLVGIIFEKGESSFDRIHVDGTRGLIAAALKAGVGRFVYMSALGARKEAPGPYHRTKFTAETLVRESGLDWTIFRPSVIFGPGDKFVNRLAGIIRKSPFIPVIGSGRTRLQPMSVRDVGAAVCLAVGNPVSFGKTYDLGGPEALSYEEIFRLIASVLKIKKRVVRIPEALVYPGAYLSNWLLPDPPITPGQLAMMGEDNICNPSDAVHDFQLSLKPFEAGIREYLKSNL